MGIKLGVSRSETIIEILRNLSLERHSINRKKGKRFWKWTWGSKLVGSKSKREKRRNSRGRTRNGRAIYVSGLR